MFFKVRKYLDLFLFGNNLKNLNCFFSSSIENRISAISWGKNPAISSGTPVHSFCPILSNTSCFNESSRMDEKLYFFNKIASALMFFVYCPVMGQLLGTSNCHSRENGNPVMLLYDFLDSHFRGNDIFPQ